MRYPRGVKIFRGQVDAAPFIGVVFLLVIFLLLQSSLVFPPGLRIELPETEGLAGIPGPKVYVAIDANGQYYLKNQVVDSKTLREHLARQLTELGEELVLVIMADESVTHGEIIRVSRLASDCGIRGAAVAMRPGPGFVSLNSDPP